MIKYGSPIQQQIVPSGLKCEISSNVAVQYTLIRQTPQSGQWLEIKVH